MRAATITRQAVPSLRIGCAGWTIPRAHAEAFPELGSHLQRYAQVFNAVEINSSFYRDHLPATYRRWADAVPETFRFAVKVSREITHRAGLRDRGELLESFLGAVHELGLRLGCLLLQLPPRLAWDPGVALRFFEQLRRLHDGPVACEPRHASWFNLAVERELSAHRISRVGADPALSLRARVPTGDKGLQYFRLHGAPRVYFDNYDEAAIQRLATRLQRTSAETAQRWCIFDNTAAGHATANALDLLAALRSA